MATLFSPPDAKTATAPAPMTSKIAPPINRLRGEAKAEAEVFSVLIWALPQGCLTTQKLISTHSENNRRHLRPDVSAWPGRMT